MSHWDVLGGVDHALTEHARLSGKPRIRPVRKRLPGIPMSLFERLWDNPTNRVISATDDELAYTRAARDLNG